MLQDENLEKFDKNLRKVIVRDLQQDIGLDFIYDQFCEIGEIETIQTINYDFNGEFRKIALITFNSRESANLAAAKFEKNVDLFKLISNKFGSRIYIQNLPQAIDYSILEKQLSKFGIIISIFTAQNIFQKQQNSLVVQFLQQSSSDEIIQTLQPKLKLNQDLEVIVNYEDLKQKLNGLEGNLIANLNIEQQQEQNIISEDKQEKQVEIKKQESESSQQKDSNCILVSNLDQEIKEEQIQNHFKEIGEILYIKLMKLKKKTGPQLQAIIAFSSSEEVTKARQKLHKSVIIKNQISVNLYFNPQQIEKKANIFISNLPENANEIELEELLKKFGTIVSIKINSTKQGEQLNYGYVQFSNIEEALLLIQETIKFPIIYNESLLKFEQFKDKFDRKEMPTALFFKGFTKPIPKRFQTQIKYYQVIEFGWKLIIQNYFENNQNCVSDCFVKVDKDALKPWCIIYFNNNEQAKENYDLCDLNRKHSCFCSNSIIARKLFNIANLPQKEGIDLFSDDDVDSLFIEINKGKQDIFQENFDDFFFNYVSKDDIKTDPRLLLIQNIQNNIKSKVLQKYFEYFGKVISLSTKSGPNNLIQCFVQYQTQFDANQAQREILNPNFNNDAWVLKDQIFKNYKPLVYVVMDGKKNSQKNMEYQ